MRIKINATSSYSTLAPPQVDTSDLQRAQRDLASLANEMPNVAVRALNKAMTGVKTDSKSVIRDAYNIKASTLDKRFYVKRATRNDISGYVRSMGYHVGLTSDLSVSTSQIKTGVSVNIKKATGRQLIPRAFIQPGRNSGKLIVLRRPGLPRGQHENLYARYGPPGSAGGAGSRATLDAFYGPHPEILYNAPENWAKIQKHAADRIDTNIEREIDAEFRRMDGKW